MAVEERAIGSATVLKGVPTPNTLMSEHTPRVKVAFQNICRGLANANVFLEWCGREGVDIAFIGEAWRERNSAGTQQRMGYMMGAGFKGEDLVVAYWKDSLRGKIQVVLETERAVGIEIGGRFCNGG